MVLVVNLASAVSVVMLLESPNPKNIPLLSEQYASLCLLIAVWVSGNALGATVRYWGM